MVFSLIVLLLTGVPLSVIEKSLSAGFLFDLCMLGYLLPVHDHMCPTYVFYVMCS